MREIKFRGYTTEGEKPRWIEGCGVEKIKYLGTNDVGIAVIFFVPSASFLFILHYSYINL